jgi:hypothetical protein
LKASDHFLPYFRLVHLADSSAGIDERIRAQRESIKPDAGAP